MFLNKIFFLLSKIKTIFSKLSGIVKRSLVVKIILIIFVLIFSFYLFLKFLPYPDLTAFMEKPYSLKIVDRNGEIIQILPLENGDRREFTSINKIPSIVKNIFIKSEDKRFYYHFGFDIFAMIRSTYINFKSKKIVTGASTITMQLSRIVTPVKSGFSGKIIEIWNSLRIEAKLSKDKILELWLNSIPYGYRSIGIQSASKNIFGVELENVSTGEALSLAVIPRSPEKYNPFNNQDNLLKASYDLSKKLNISISLDEIKNDINNKKTYIYENKADHFVNYIKPLIDRKQYINGMTVETSLNLKLNIKIETFLKYYLQKYKDFRVSNGAVLAIDNKTGEIIMYIGSNDFLDKTNSGEIDGIQVTNQPGSTLKPFLYGMALDDNFLPSTILPDIPQDFGGENLYFPLNFNKRFNGPVRLRVALASSLNVPAVYLVTKIGVQNFIGKLLDLEFDSLNKQRDNLGTGIVLGNAEVSLYELTRAFSVFPRGGKINNITFLKENERSFKNGESVYSEYASFLICDILSDNSSRLLGFSPGNVLNTNFKAMFKTGTSNQFNNVWAIGATSEYTVGVWVGNFNGNTVIGEVGNSIPALAVVECLKLLNDINKPEDFKIPGNIIKKEICSLSGKLATNYCQSKTYEYFKNDENIDSCDYHYFENGKILVKYPSIFSGYIQTDNVIFNDNNNEEQSIKILRPNNNSIFFIDPNIPIKNQAIKIEIINNNNNEILDLNINGKIETKLTYPYKYYFKLKKGNWNITVSGKKSKDSINITIE